MTSTTKAQDNSKVNSTSLTEARMVCVRSTMVVRWMPGGIKECIRASAVFILSTVSMTLAPGCLKTRSMTAV